MPRSGAKTDGGLVDEITDHLAFEIASGAFGPGDRLPPVRELAERHGINASTVQVVIARLRTAGFVESSGSRRGGMIVRDIERVGGLETWRFLFRFAQQLPERATKLFEGFLKTRRILVLSVIERVVAEPRKFDLGPLRREVERLALTAQRDPSPEQMARAEMRAARLLLQLVDEPVLLALYNTIGEVLFSVPAVLEAMYPHPSFNVAMWTELLEAWDRGEAAAGGFARAEQTLAAFHVECVRRFRELLEAERG